MKVEALTVRNFRNIAALDVVFPDRGVVIIGENGHGKTNFLEAVYYLVLFRSLRGAKDRELVRFGTPGFFAAATAHCRVTAGYEIAGKRKKVTVDGNSVETLREAVGRIQAVAFSPADRMIVAGGPSGRRRYVDVLLALSNQAYLAQLVTMRAALKQRNAALRQGKVGAARAFDEPFVKAAEQVGAARLAWIASHAGRFSEVCRALGEKAETAMSYHPHGWTPGDSAEGLAEALETSINRDLRRGVTTVGPHRDDIRLSLDGRDLRAYGSAGQQRTAAVALRILEAQTLGSAAGQPPIALYDDVFAELDQDRQERLLHLIRETLPGQSFVTAPRDSEVPAALLDRPRWTMRGGELAGPEA